MTGRGTTFFFCMLLMAILAFPGLSAAGALTGELPFAVIRNASAVPAGNLTHVPPGFINIPSVVENETFTFEMQCDYDGSDVMFISVVYRQGGTTDQVATMAHEPWQASGEYRVWLDILPRTGNLTYHLHLETTTGGNYLYPAVGNHTVPVRDVTPPTVSKDDMGFMAGNLLTIWYYVDDNVNVTSATFTYKFPGQANWTTRDLPSIGDGARGLLFSPWYILGDIECFVTVSDGTHVVRYPTTGLDTWPIIDDSTPQLLHYTSTMTNPVFMVSWGYVYHGHDRTGNPRDAVPRATAMADIPFLLGFYENGPDIDVTLYYWTEGEERLAHETDLEVVWHDAVNGTFLVRGTVPSIDREAMMSYSVRATDAYGNSAYFKYHKFNISVEDLTLPVIERVAGSAGDIMRNGTIRVKASDDVGLRSVVLILDDDLNDTASGQFTMSDVGGGWYSFPVPQPYVEGGEFFFRVVAMDGSDDATQNAVWPTASDNKYESHVKVTLALDEPDPWALWVLLACLAVPTILLVILPDIVKR